jgi:2-keto-3-deoxy-6-phosphogluconate aldolase
MVNVRPAETFGTSKFYKQYFYLLYTILTIANTDISNNNINGFFVLAMVFVLCDAGNNF